MARIVVFGLGPLRWEESDRLFALPLRSWHFARTLAEEGHKVTLLPIRLSVYEGWPADKRTEARRDGIDVVSMSEHVFHERPLAIRRMIREIAPDCIVGVNVYPASIAVNFAGELPFWADVNGDPMAEAQGKAARYADDEVLLGFHRVFAPVLRRADRFSTCSERQKLALVGQLGVAGRLTAKNDGHDFVCAIPNAVDDEEIRVLGALRRPTRGPNDPFFVLWTGGYNTWVDEATLFDALERAMKAHPGIRFVSLGGAIPGHDDKTFASFRGRVAASPFAERFQFPGWVPSSELASYYRSSHAAILVDRYTAEGLLGARTRFLDWLAAGIPIVATDLSEIATDLGRRGLAQTAECGDAEALAEGLLKLARDPEYAREVSERGREHARTELRASILQRPLLEWAARPERAPDLDRLVRAPQKPGRLDVVRENVRNFRKVWREDGPRATANATVGFARRKIRAAGRRLLDAWTLPEPLAVAHAGSGELPLAAAPRRGANDWRKRIAAFERPPEIGVVLLVPTDTEPDVVSWTLDQIARQYYTHFRILLPILPQFDAALRERLREKLDWATERNLKVEAIDGPEAADAIPVLHDFIAKTDYVALVGAGDLLRPDALAELVEAAIKNDADLVYADESEIDETNVARRPFLKPAWSPDFFLSYPYIGQPALYRTSIVRRTGGLRVASRPRAIEYDLALRVTETTSRIEHVPEVLCRRWTPFRRALDRRLREEQETHLEEERALVQAVWRRGLDARIERGQRPGAYRVRRTIVGEPKVSILIPTRDRVDLLKPCVDSIDALTTWRNREVIVVDNGTRDPKTLRYLDKIPHRVLRIDEPFNFSRLNNQAARKANGEYLVLLNNDTKVIAPEWIEAMLEHAQREDVGAVGAKLLLPDGTIQHAGIVYMPTRFTYAHGRFRDAGQDAFTDVVRDYSAVTAACMMVRRSTYLKMRGLDERFAVAYNDVDFCLRLRRRGLLVVYTPHAVLYHHESSSRGFGKQPRSDDDLLEKRWLATLDPDPYLGALGLREEPIPGP